jgi:hypothetical protein
VTRSAAALALVAACAAPPTDGAGPGAIDPAVALSDSVLAHATYRSIVYFDSALHRFEGGRAIVDVDAETGDTTRIFLLPGTAPARAGDGAGTAWALVPIAWNGGGTLTAVHLALVRRRPGDPPEHVATAALGDRDRVDSARWNAAADTATVFALVHRDDDPACCPTLSLRMTWARAGDSLQLARADTLPPR